jgi:hypothetical protein
MIIEIMLRRRLTLDESMRELNDRLVTAFAKISSFWGPGKSPSDAPFDGDEDVATLDLRKSLQKGLGGQAIYHGRFPGYMEDHASNDDMLMLRLNTEKIEYIEFCTNTLPLLIQAFEPYVATVETDEDVGVADWRVMSEHWQKTRQSIGGRQGVFRIWPVNFFDDILCRRSFGIGAAEVVRLAAPECERAEVLNGGAFLLVTTELVVGTAALNDLDARVRSRLTQQ